MSDPDILNLNWINDDYRYNQDEEEPFLAMRLFQLGLKEWAAKTVEEQSRRWWLRQWKFKYDTIPGGGDFLGQDFALVDNFRIIGRDVVVLKVERNSGMAGGKIFENENLPRSGRFLINRPGVFFDHVYFDTKEAQLGDPLWLTQTTQWPDSAGQLATLISRPGYFLNSEENEPFREFDNTCGDSDLPHMFFDLQGLTTDSKFGSSGGSVFTTNKFEIAGRPDICYMAANGIQSGAFWLNNNYDNKTWHSAGPIGVSEPNSSYDGINTNIFTAIDEDGVDITRRDTTDDPKINTGDPKPCSEGEGGNCLPCAYYDDATKNCDAFTYTASDTGGGNGNLPIHPRGIKEDDESSQQTRGGDRRVNCLFDAKGNPYTTLSRARKDKMFPGVVVGLMGSSVGEYGKEKGVGSLYAICAPLSSKSYTDHWQFLNTKGSVLPGPNIRGNVGWSSLNLKSHDTYTVQENAPRGHKFRPVPMKFCPPNYIMNGLRASVIPSGFIGFTGIHCRQSANPNAQTPAGDSNIVVWLDASLSGVSGYTLYGEEYSLDQRIGNIGGGDGFIVDFICPQDGFISGLEMSHDDNGMLDKFHPYCIPHAL